MIPKAFSKTFITIYQVFKPLYILMLICGFNLIFNKNIYAKITSRIYSVILITIFFYSNMTCCPTQEISFIWSLIEYSVYSVFMMFYESRLLTYMNKVVELDTYLRINTRHYRKTRTKIYLVIATMFLFRSFYITVFCLLHVCYTSLILFLFYEFSMLALDINRIWRYCLFEEIWRRLKVLRKRIEENPEENYYLYVHNNKMMRENKIKFGLCLYKRIADLLDLISPELNASLFMGVLCCLPKLIINVYRILLVIDSRIPFEMLGIMLFNIFQTSVFIFSPCVVIELYQAEVEGIRLFLMHRLIYETDPEVKTDIQVFLQYTRIRTFRYKVFRVIPMNLQLPLHLMNFCTTYVIVIVNFTKVFDNN